MGDLLLVHWHEDEARVLARELRGHGWRVARWTPALKLSRLREEPPAAVVISLRRRPSHGREVADALWFTKWGRAIPIVFLDGAPDKVAVTRKNFGAASYVTVAELPAELERIVAGAEQGPDGPGC